MSSDESDWSDVGEDDVIQKDENHSGTPCLFCDVTFLETNLCFEHLLINHAIDMKFIIQAKKMETYDYIKFINYVRTKEIIPSKLESISLEDCKDEKWLIPSLQNDLLLQVDIESIIQDVTKSSKSDVDLCYQLDVATKRADLAEEFLQRTIDDLHSCQKKLKTLMLGDSDSLEPHHADSTNVESSGYFSSYAHTGIHEEMLKDKVRTESYRSLMYDNPNLFNGATLLDVGCGTSILSMFAAQVGARKVIAVDNSDIAYQAMDIVKENGLGNVIEVKKGKAEDIDVKEKFDVIISEWMGYFLLFESMLDTVLFCRDNYLSENGCIYPDKCNIQLVALSDENLHAGKVTFWHNVYGFKMSAIKPCVLEEPLIQVVDPSKVASEPCILQSYDLMKVGASELDFDIEFELLINKDGCLTALVGYFDIFFEKNLINTIYFSTGPAAVTTHWKQTIFLLKDPFMIKNGDIIRGRMICKKNRKDHRALDIVISFHDENKQVTKKQHYILS